MFIIGQLWVSRCKLPCFIALSSSQPSWHHITDSWSSIYVSKDAPIVTLPIWDGQNTCWWSSSPFFTKKSNLIKYFSDILDAVSQNWRLCHGTGWCSPSPWCRFAFFGVCASSLPQWTSPSMHLKYIHCPH